MKKHIQQVTCDRCAAQVERAWDEPGDLPEGWGVVEVPGRPAMVRRELCSECMKIVREVVCGAVALAAGETSIESAVRQGREGAEAAAARLAGADMNPLAAGLRAIGCQCPSCVPRDADRWQCRECGCEQITIAKMLNCAHCGAARP